jgi:undecaprenyl-diphosphatase
MYERSFVGRLNKRYSWHIHWVLRHWTAAQYTVAHVAIGLAIAGLGTWAFTATARSAFSDRLIADWDDQVFALFASWATPLATTVFRVITWMGSFGVAGVAIAGVVLFVLRKRWVNALSIAVVVLGGQLLIYILKLVYSRKRPEEDAVLINSLGVTFPSAHAMEAMIVYGLLAYFLILWLKHWGAATAIVLSTTLLVLLIGFSRLYLGVNYLSDVVCGLVGGVVWISSCIIALELLRRGQVGDRRRQRRVRTRVMPVVDGSKSAP